MKLKAGERQLTAFCETAYAEFGSALEMVAAAKSTNSPNLCYGYFMHAKDEYNHAAIFLDILSRRAKAFCHQSVHQFRFSPAALYRKGYISNNGFLVETLNHKKFVSFVYTNELLAKKSFDNLLNIVGGPSSEDGSLISQIMQDELRHHGHAKEHFLARYSQNELSVCQLRDTLANKFRKLYDVNLKILDRVFQPIYSLVASFAILILLAIKLSDYQRNNKNLLEINSSSVL